MSKHFEVTVRGQYQSLHEGSGVPTLKPFEETFNLPSQEAALSSICKHLLGARLKKKYPDFIRFRTHELVGMRLVGYTPNKDVLQMSIEEMRLDELYDFCILKQIMIDPYKHTAKDIFAIRNMVQKSWTEKRTAIKEAATSKEGNDAREADALRAANDLDPTAKDPVINVNEQKLTQNAKKATESLANGSAGGGIAAGPVESMDPLPPEESDDINEPILE